jgi:hypothetical protein
VNLFAAFAPLGGVLSVDQWFFQTCHQLKVDPARGTGGQGHLHDAPIGHDPDEIFMSHCEAFTVRRHQAERFERLRLDEFFQLLDVHVETLRFKITGVNFAQRRRPIASSRHTLFVDPITQTITRLMVHGLTAR